MRSIYLSAIAALLAGCGGGDGSPSIPADVSTSEPSVPAYTQYRPTEYAVLDRDSAAGYIKLAYDAYTSALGVGVDAQGSADAIGWDPYQESMSLSAPCPSFGSISVQAPMEGGGWVTGVEYDISYRSCSPDGNVILDAALEVDYNSGDQSVVGSLVASTLDETDFMYADFVRLEYLKHVPSWIIGKDSYSQVDFSGQFASSEVEDKVALVRGSGIEYVLDEVMIGKPYVGTFQVESNGEVWSATITGASGFDLTDPYGGVASHTWD